MPTLQAFTFRRGELSRGLEATKNQRTNSPEVVLGQYGAGRLAVRVEISERPPPVFDAGRVVRAALVRLARLTPRGGPAYALSGAAVHRDDGVLVRIDTDDDGRSGANGGWEPVEGNPVDVVVGWGGQDWYGVGGRFDDGLVIVPEGGLLRVQTNSGAAYALWLEDGRLESQPWTEFIVAEACEDGDAVQLHGAMPALTFAHGEITVGLEVCDATTGPAIVLGQPGVRAWSTEVSVLGAEVVDGRVLVAGVLELWEGDQETRSPPSDVHALNMPRACEPDGTLLLRVLAPYTRRRHETVEVWEGRAVEITHGRLTRGRDGRRAAARDSLWAMSPGAVLRVGSGSLIYTLQNSGGTVVVSDRQR